jgi:2-polyprenyl-3-methyl-5-hydroxy-6-metoxy-1,4-benzoquinol methylase
VSSTSRPDQEALNAEEGGLYRVPPEALMQIFREKYSRTATLGWGPKMRLEHNYFTPDDHYEALVDRLLAAGDEWCDVGCGRDVFPNYPELARRCADRCAFLYGIDPDDNIQDNPFVDERFQGIVEDCPTTHTFDLITMRMVAEHIENPPAVLTKLRAMLKPRGRLVIYTPHKWAPMSVLANAVPFALHNPLKRLLWATEARDTFPTQHKMNTMAELQAHAAGAGLKLVHYERLDDCRITTAYRRLNRIELTARSGLRRFGIPYPEACILAVLQPVVIDATVA